MKNTSNKPGKGSGRRPLMTSYDEFSSRWDGINGFGDRKPLHGIPDEPITNMKTKNKKSKKKQMCPHCATMNLVKQDEYTSKCVKCGYSN